LIRKPWNNYLNSMKSKEIRSQFIRFFEKQGHTFVKSAAIYPKDDPSLLFTNAGMNQFKNIFLGKATDNTLKRAVNSQKCMRVSGKHNDLEEVGRDGTHHTFFEMLGNWSFGDYYKPEAIEWAWTLLTKEFGLPKTRLYATVFKDDNEAETLWKKITDIAPDHIVRFPEKYNFWEMGDTGPCGPCSEIHIDLGANRSCGPNCRVNCDCGRFMEIWNLVFIQYNREKDGSLKPLAQRHVDTGMGFERLVSLVQGKSSNYETDLFMPIIDRVAELSKQPYSPGPDGVPFRVIADHLRAITFAIADDVLPGNEGRGYVIRRLLRRAYRFSRKLGFTAPFMHTLVPDVVKMMGSAFPEIEARADFIIKIIENEESSFERTLDRGLSLFDEIVLNAKQKKSVVLSGSEVFKLYDTYGFPVDLTRQMAQEQGFSVDEKAFEEEMKAQKDRARAGSRFRDMEGKSGEWMVLSDGPSSVFTGYEKLADTVTLRKILKSEKGARIITDKTPFYAESGGQIGDQGTLTDGKVTLTITDTRKENGAIVHYVESAEPLSILPASFTANVNEARRRDIQRNHTATHILHYALHQVLGEHAKQSGSSVDADRFRFDYNHFAAPSDEELLQIEKKCNELILLDLPVTTFETSMKEAEKLGATALFGEKYGDTVRIIKIADFSMELCGGTHVSRTGEIGYLQIVSESSVASGIRRIEAITGIRFGEECRKNSLLMRTLARSFKTSFDKVPELVAAQTEKLRELDKEIKALRVKNAFSNTEALLAQAVNIKGVALVREHFSGYDRDTLQQKCDALLRQLKSGVVVMMGDTEGSAALSVAVSDDLVASKGLHAGKLIQKLAEMAGGKGGGKPNRAQAGGKDVAKLVEAFDKLPTLLESFLA